jgi:hypothetical protein
MKYLLCLATITILLIGQACSLTTSVHFNRDFSGTHETVIDMSEMLGFAAMMDSTSDDQNDMIAQMRHSLDSLNIVDMYRDISGITDAHATVSDEGVLSIGFRFKNVEALNASFETLKERMEDKASNLGGDSMEMMPTDFLGGGTQSFVRNKKSITHSFSSDGTAEDLIGEEGMGELEMISSMMDYSIEMSFDRKIKSADLTGVNLIEQGKNVIKARVDLGKMLKDGHYSITVKTK